MQDPPATRAAHGSADATAPTPAAPADGAAWLLAAQALVIQHADPDAAAAAALAELVQALACERVSLGWRQRNGRVRLAATSAGDARQEQGSPWVRQLEAAMDEAVDEGAVVLFPGSRGARRELAPAHAELVRGHEGLVVATVPIVGADGIGGVLLFERLQAFDGAALQRVQDAALFVGPWLDMHRRLHAPRLTRLAQALRPGRPGRQGRSGADGAPQARRRAWLAAPVLLAAAAAWPVTHEVVAPSRVDGAGQQVLAAAIDGFIAQADVRPGAAVKAGELLARLQDREPELQRQRWLAETAQLDKQYREALSQGEQAPIALAHARLEQAQAQLALAEAELARTRIVAPFDGIVIQGDWQQAAGMPVQRGQPLFTVAPTLQLKVLAEVDEADIARLRQGQPARVLFAAQGLPPAPFRVERVAPVAAVVDGRNVFEVEGALTGAAAEALRPGQRGVARIEVGESHAGMLLAERVGHWLRRWQWRLLG